MKYNNSGSTLAALGIDLAKQSFQLHGVDVDGDVVLIKNLAEISSASSPLNYPLASLA